MSDFQGTQELVIVSLLLGPALVVCLIAGAVRLAAVAGLLIYRPGYCRRCGYDLRATPERCPECGTPTG